MLFIQNANTLYIQVPQNCTVLNLLDYLPPLLPLLSCSHIKYYYSVPKKVMEEENTSQEMQLLNFIVQHPDFPAPLV